MSKCARVSSQPSLSIQIEGLSLVAVNSHGHSIHQNPSPSCHHCSRSLALPSTGGKYFHVPASLIGLSVSGVRFHRSRRKLRITLSPCLTPHRVCGPHIAPPFEKSPPPGTGLGTKGWLQGSNPGMNPPGKSFPCAHILLG